MSVREYLRSFPGLLAFILAVALTTTAATTASAEPMSCDQLAGFALSNLPDAPVTIASATSVAADAGLPAYCNVAGVIGPGAIGFEVRLPAQNWNGKFWYEGCGAFCGAIFIGSANDALAKGYAVTANDMGHASKSPIDGTFGHNNRQAEIDFAFRATHAGTVVAKAIVGAFYGEAPSRAYFRGCSTGGRQGMVEAQRYPHDFDGIVAGAPVMNETGAGALHLLWSVKANLDELGKPILGEADVRLLHDAAIKRSDPDDGVLDGMIGDPRTSDFDPGVLACKAGQNGDCLSVDQVAAARKLYGGPKNAAGEQIFPGGLFPGSELNWLGNIVVEAGKPSIYLLFGGDFVKYLAFETDPGPNYDPLSFDFDNDVARLAFMETLYSGSNPDLRAFRDSGGKLIMYQGWADPSVTPQGTVDYYEMMARTMGGPADTKEFARLFMVPGMGHCLRSASPGVNDFDLIEAIEAWVEDGKAPEVLVGWRKNKAGEVEITRPLYPYPQTATYRGGDTNKAESFGAPN